MTKISVAVTIIVIMVALIIETMIGFSMFGASWKALGFILGLWLGTAIFSIITWGIAHPVGYPW